MSQPSNCFEYMNEDSGYQEYSRKIRANWKTIREQESDQRQKLWDLNAFLIGMDAVRQRLCSIDEESTKTDKDLVRITGECSDCWSSTYGHALEMMKDKAVELCSDVTNSEMSIGLAKAKNKNLNREQDELGEKLKDEFLKLEKIKDVEVQAS